MNICIRPSIKIFWFTVTRPTFTADWKNNVGQIRLKSIQIIFSSQVVLIHRQHRARWPTEIFFFFWYMCSKNICYHFTIIYDRRIFLWLTLKGKFSQDSAWLSLLIPTMASCIPRLFACTVTSNSGASVVQWVTLAIRLVFRNRCL